MESISRISSLLETARDLTLEAARDASAAKKGTARPIPAQKLKALLDSRLERDVLEGLRRLVALTYTSQSISPYFTHALKTLSLPFPTVRKLVAHILIQLAPSHPDTALLAINTLQKSLSDSAPPLRSLALRTMSSIRVPAISQIVLLAIKRGVQDMSPYVRRAAALAIPKAYRLDPALEPELVEGLVRLLGDKQYFVAGAAVQAYAECWADRIDLLHPYYRKLVRQMVDMDEWGQLAFLKVMLGYCRRCFPRRTKRIRKGGAEKKGKGKDPDSFYDDEETREDQDEGDGGEGDFEEAIILDPDLDLLLRAAQPLLHNRSSAVIIAVTSCFLYLGTPTYLELAVGPLIALLRSPQDIQLVALHNIVQVCLIYPKPFVQYASHFLIRLSEPPAIRRSKLELLTLIFPHAPPHIAGLILAELAHFSASQDPTLVQEAVRAIGRCAQTSDEPTSRRCLHLLLDRVSSPDPLVVAESLQVVRQLIQRDPLSHTHTVVRLAKNLDSITNPQARASIIWLVGEFAAPEAEDGMAPDVLRILVRNFADESEQAKRQIVLLAAKVYLHYLNVQNATQKSARETEEDLNGSQKDEAADSDMETRSPPNIPIDESHPIVLLWQYVQLLARYDTSYDLRDRLRVYKSLLAIPTSTDLASLLLLAPKPVPQIPSPSESRRGYAIGSASLVVGDEVAAGGFRGYEPLPEWVREGEQPIATVRGEGGAGRYEVKKEVPASERLDRALEEERGTGRANGWREKTLDDWLAEDEEEEDEESDGSEETEEESSEEETEEESEEDEEDEGTDDESAALRPSA